MLMRRSSMKVPAVTRATKSTTQRASVAGIVTMPLLARLVLVPLVLMTVVLAMAPSHGHAIDPVPSNLNQQQTLKQLQLQTLEGQPLKVCGADQPAWTVFVFISRTCPIANAYQPRLRELQQQYEKRSVRFVQVYVQADLTTEDARAHVHEFDLKSQVVLDTQHQLARALDAKVTPEAFVVDQQGTVHYRGRIDDQFAALGKKRPQPTQHDLRAALEECTSGKAVSMPMTPAVGCLISK